MGLQHQHAWPAMWQRPGHRDTQTCQMESPKKTNVQLVFAKAAIGALIMVCAFTWKQRRVRSAGRRPITQLRVTKLPPSKRLPRSCSGSTRASTFSSEISSCSDDEYAHRRALARSRITNVLGKMPGDTFTVIM